MRTRERRHPAPRHGGRGPLDARPRPGRGARDFAIALVLAYHFEVPGVRGGFLGVGLFFVLSGFLITTLLLDEHRASSRIDLVGFWYRRARRLLPALFLLIAVVVIVAVWATPIEKGGVPLGPARGARLRSQLAVHRRGQSYFNEFMTASPVRTVVAGDRGAVLPRLAAHPLGRVRRPLGRHPSLAWLEAGRRPARRAALGSAALMALTYHEADPSLAYFSTFARAHELLVGALAAVLLAHVSRIRSVIGQ